MVDKIKLIIDFTEYSTLRFKYSRPGIIYPHNTPHEIVVPIPGIIKQVLVKTGDVIKRGDVILVLEAMKSYNKIIADHPGKITEILVNPGDRVIKDQVVVKMD
ncbi:MAG: hypothetical protein APR63_07330 [Desulfuromonas sp. SDB]|nr:MAG: hypothetical protein APR63_07330 [Desulfuromonas sp. SDB]